MNKIAKTLVGGILACNIFTGSVANVSPMINVKKTLIDKYLVEYLTHSKDVSKYLNKINERKSLYLPLVVEYSIKFKNAGIEYNGMPLDNPKDMLDFLISHEYVESRGDLECISSAGAVGPRQFMPSTAKEWGLNDNLYVNESKNPKKSTRAALNYILHYAKAYNRSADLALAAYNTNPKRIEKALKHNPSIKDDTDIPMEFLRAETIHYVPKIDAMYIALKNPKSYGLNLDSKEKKFDVYRTKQGDSLPKIAHKFHSNVKDIVQYNGLKSESRLPINYSLIIPKNF